MTAASISPLAIAAFGDPSAGVWGVVVGGADPAIVVGVLEDTSESRFEQATLENISEPRFEPSALDDSASSPASNPTSNPASNPAVDPASNPASNPAVDPASNPASNPAVDPASNPASNPAVDPASNPASNPAVDPASNPASKPASKPAWTLAGAEHNLTITPIPEQLGTPGLAGELESCRISGTIALGGHQRELDCAGVRCDAAGQAGSLRLVATFFERDVEIALLATRPPGAKGQDRDAVAAVVRGEPAAELSVFDPRLSTTYGADGNPSRVGIELWLGATEEDDLYPRRASGEATSSHAVLRRSGTRLDAQAMCCQSRGLDGAGVYVFARPDGV